MPESDENSKQKERHLRQKRKQLRQELLPVFDDFYDRINRCILRTFFLLFLLLCLTAWASKYIVGTEWYVVLALCTLIGIAAFWRYCSLFFREVKRLGLICNECDHDLVVFGAANRFRSETERKFPGWKFDETVPLRCHSCGAFVEAYAGKKLLDTSAIMRSG